MSTPTGQAPQEPGISASAGVTLSDWVTVNLTVTPQGNSDIACDMTCNGRDVTVLFRSNGEVDLDVHEEPDKG